MELQKCSFILGLGLITNNINYEFESNILFNVKYCQVYSPH
jgi:hypothetical protein